MNPLDFGTGLKNQSLIDRLSIQEWQSKSLQVDMLRLDKIHPVVSGNKWFKLKYHLQKAIEKKVSRLITWGGAYSNHIVATAYTSNQMGLPSIGIIRGEEPSHWSHTLKDAKKYGMNLRFVSRSNYARRNQKDAFDQLVREFPNSHFIPEGGGGEEGIQGAGEILKLVDAKLYTHLICAVGSGTTFRGLSRGLNSSQSIIG
ncbi:MAG: pyridoxal-phosphate dependent enzyme, partial [Chitinophagales bacterium]